MQTPTNGLAKFVGMRCLVTGASGFLGSNLCARLLQLGAEVHATTRKQFGDPKGISFWWEADFSNLVTVQRVFREVKPQVVVHLAGLSSAAPELEMVIPTFQSLVTSTINVLVTATSFGCSRVITTGSLTEPKPSQTGILPSSPYAAAKLTGSIYSQLFHQLYGAPVVFLRPFMTYGPAQRREKIVPHVVLSLLRGESPKLASGHWQADWVFVDDVVDGFIRAMIAPCVEGTQIDIGSGKLMAARDVVQKLINMIDPKIKPIYGAYADRPSEPIRVAETQVAKVKLNWVAKTSLDEGLAKTVQWYKNQLNHR